MEKAERAARKRNQRQAERWPLLEISGDLHQFTANEMLAEWDKYQAQQEQAETEMAARAMMFRSKVGKVISPKELAQLDEHRKRYPKAACYAADFWHRIYKEIQQCRTLESGNSSSS